MTAFSPALHRFGDVSVRLSVELGRADMPLRDVLALGEGSVVGLNRLTDELLDVTANGKVVARGEVIAQDGRFALRIVSLAGSEGEASETQDSAVHSARRAPIEPGSDGPAYAPAEVPISTGISDPADERQQP